MYKVTIAKAKMNDYQFMKNDNWETWNLGNEENETSRDIKHNLIKIYKEKKFTSFYNIIKRMEGLIKRIKKANSSTN